MSASDATALTAVDLVKTYRTGRGTPPVRALDGLSVEVATGSVFALLGPNGAGKSTTVRILTTLSRPDSGQAFVAGLDVLRRPDDVRRTIGLVSQKPSGDPMATGRENLVLAARIQGLSRAEATERADRLLTRFGLADAAEITELAAEERVTVLLTTHYLDEADRMADRLAIVDSGRVVVTGTPDALKSELRGDTVTVELEAAAVPMGLAALSRLRGLHDLTADGTTLRARADAGAGAVPAVLTALDDAGARATAVTVARPSLDDVYLRHVGRGFEVAA
jgi:ABC-2 type transport system ATP-binding protein